MAKSSMATSIYRFDTFVYIESIHRAPRCASGTWYLVPGRTPCGCDEDLVDLNEAADGLEVLKIPATRLAEKIGRRIVANVVMLGFVAAVTDVASPEALKKAVLDSVPRGTEELNERAFDTGFDYGQELGTKVEAKTSTGGDAASEAKGTPAKKGHTRIRVSRDADRQATTVSLSGGNREIGEAAGDRFRPP